MVAAFSTRAEIEHYLSHLSYDHSWKRELAGAYKDPQALLASLELDANRETLYGCKPLLKDYTFPLLVTSYFQGLMEKGNINDPLLLQSLPLEAEQIKREDFLDQPLAEQDNFIPIRNIVHKYQERLLFLPKGSCAINCRYCFRRNFPYAELVGNKKEWRVALDYVFNHGIKEVIFSGGDPLMMNDKEFAWLIQEILLHNLEVSALEEASGEASQGEASPGVKASSATTPKVRVERLRIHTRLPLVLPQRITDTFLDLLSFLAEEGVQVVIVFHINHPQELGSLFVSKAKALANRGVTLLNQSVLLKGINDNAPLLSTLSAQLFKARILPYYLHVLDKVQGASHFLVSDEQAHQIYQELQSLTSGYLVPKLAREEVGKENKTLLL